MALLLIRPDRQDTRVVEDLLAPGGGPRLLPDRPPVSALVIDANVAITRREFAETAAASGVPALVDPLTFGLQTEPSPTSPFARLPYASRATVRPDDVDLSRVVDETLDHQLDCGATGLIMPYFHIRDLGDGWAALAMRTLGMAASRRDAMGLRLGSMAILSGNRRTLSSPAGLQFVEHFGAAAADAGAQILAVCVSPAGAPRDGYDGVARLASVLERASGSGLPVLAWRQGAYGLLMSALGASGYECGIGQGEASDVAGLQARIRTHRPLSDDMEFRRRRRAVYLPLFNRSIPATAAEALLGDPTVQGEVLCDVPGCCPTTADTTARQRHHAVRARAHQLAEVDEQPARWRTQHVLRALGAAVGTARRANEVLQASGESYRVPVDNLTAQIDYLQYRGNLGGRQLSA